MPLSIDSLTEHDIAKTIDHSLLRPELDDAFVEDGCRLAAKYHVASVCVRPADVRRATAILAGTDLAVGTTIGFPHGNHATEVKVFEAKRALADGATELDMVLQIGALKSGRDADGEGENRAAVGGGDARAGWGAKRALADGATELDMVLQIGALKSGPDADVEADIRAVVEVGHAAGAIVKVIFENAYLTDGEKVRACHLTEAAGGDFVKTSTGFASGGAT